MINEVTVRSGLTFVVIYAWRDVTMHFLDPSTSICPGMRIHSGMCEGLWHRTPLFCYPEYSVALVFINYTNAVFLQDVFVTYIGIYNMTT